MTQMCTASREVDAALGLLRVLVGIAETTVDENTGALTLTQFRALRTAERLAPVTMGRVAAELGTNPSTVTRACEKLVTLGLLRRAQNPLNKRETLLAPTAAGKQLVDSVDHDRRFALAAVLERLDEETRATLAVAFEKFTAAAAQIHR